MVLFLLLLTDAAEINTHWLCINQVIMNKISYSFPLNGNDVAELLSQRHRTPSSGEFNNPKSWIWEIRDKYCKGKFGLGKANFRIFADKIVFVNAAHSYAWVCVFTAEFAAKRKAVSDSLAAKNAALSRYVAGFTGVALIETGHESWSYRDRDEWKKRMIIRFENGHPVEILESDSYSSNSSSGDRAYGVEPYAEGKDFCCTQDAWETLVSWYKPFLIIRRLTRDNGEHEQHEYTLNGEYVPYEACTTLIKRVKNV